jgi:hypothetical protein
VGASNGILKGMDGLDWTGWVVKKCVIIDSNQHGVSMENGKRTENQRGSVSCVMLGS